MHAHPARVLYIILWAFVFLGSAHATTISEHALSSQGIETSLLTAGTIGECLEVPFEKFADTNQRVFTLLSIHYSLNSPLNETARVEVFLNDSNEPTQKWFLQDHLSQWLRAQFLPEEVQLENTAKVCFRSGVSTDSITVFEDSLIGAYLKADFTNGFISFVPNPKPLIGKETKIVLTVINTGSESAQVTVFYRKFDLKIAPLLKGETSVNQVIEPGEEKTIEYLIKPLKSGEVLLPPATLEYKNPFGEIERVESNRAVIQVIEPEFKARGLFIPEKTRNKQGEPVRVELILKNEGNTDLQNVSIHLQIPGALSYAGTLTLNTPGPLSPSKVQSFPLEFSASEPGSYALGCEIVYVDYKLIKKPCESFTLIVDPAHADLLPAFIALALVLVGIFIYAFIYYYKKPEEPAPVLPRKRFVHTPSAETTASRHKGRSIREVP